MGNLEGRIGDLEKRISVLEELKNHTVSVLEKQIKQGLSYYELKCLIENLLEA